MKTLFEFLMHLHHRAGSLAIVVLMIPVFAWVWLAARDPVASVFNGSVPRWVLSGKVFSQRFDIRHAGSALDQPTIGKWLFWFSVMSVSSAIYTAMVRWLSDRSGWSTRWAFGICVVMLCFLLLCILSWPLLWLAQYVWSMGLTPKRTLGLLYAIQGGGLLVCFMILAVRNSKGEEVCPECSATDSLYSPHQKRKCP